jgi:hypothetical protein
MGLAAPKPVGRRLGFGPASPMRPKKNHPFPFWEG